MRPRLHHLLFGLWQRITWAVLIVVLLVNTMGSTQTEPAPIFFLHDGDLFSIRPGDTEPFQETYWGYNHAPVLSPDGQYLAYGSLPELLIDLDASGAFPINYDQHPPTNIWLMDIAARNFERIADQPAQTGDSPHLIRRTTPVWSPDSTKLAWLELDLQGAPDKGLYLVVADLETGTQTEGPDNLPGVNADAGMFAITDSLTWGKTLAFDAYAYGLLGPGMVVSITALDTQNIYAQKPIIDFSLQADTYVQQWHWVDYDGDLYLALEYPYGWQLWDYQTDRYFAIYTPPTLQSASGDGLRLSYDAETTTWTVIDSHGSYYTLPEGAQNPALSPDGQQLVYRQQNLNDELLSYDLVLWEDGWTEILLTNQPGLAFNHLVWGPMVWRVEDQPVPLPRPTMIPSATPGMG